MILCHNNVPRKGDTKTEMQMHTYRNTCLLLVYSVKEVVTNKLSLVCIEQKGKSIYIFHK